MFLRKLGRSIGLYLLLAAEAVFLMDARYEKHPVCKMFIEPQVVKINLQPSTTYLSVPRSCFGTFNHKFEC